MRDARTGLAETERTLVAEVDRLVEREKDAEHRSTLAARDLDLLATERRRLLDKKDGWDGRSTIDAEAADERARHELTDASVTVRAADRQHRADLAALAQAEAGAGGPAGAALAALASAGVTAAPLLDSVTVDETARDRWEPRLWPHSAAVVVAPRDEVAAVAALAHLPGASLVVADAAMDTAGAALDGAVASLPVASFLAALAARTEHRDGPPRATDRALAETTVGGFPLPIAGRAARIAAAREAADASDQALVAARGDERTAGLLADEAADQLGAARAVERLEALEVDERRLREDKREAEDAVVEVRARLVPARAEHLEAAVIARNHADQVRVAGETVRVRERELADERRRLRERQDERARVELGYWQRGWGGTGDDARALLGAQPATVSTVKAASLRCRAAEKLKDALDTYLRGASDHQVPPDLAEARQRRQQLADGGVGADTVDFATVARPLRDQLDGLSERDEVQSDRIRREQARRANELSAAREEVERLDGDLVVVQDMVAGLIEAALSLLSDRLDALNRGRGGFGAELRVVYDRPDSPAAPWRWRVTPRWRRSPGGAMTSYREVANGAQVKVFAIQLVLAALLAAEGGSGRILVLDELGNSLGDENRKDVLADLDQVAREQNVTILGACQNSVIEDAAGSCSRCTREDCAPEPSTARPRPPSAT